MTTTTTESTAALEHVLLSGDRAAHLGMEIVPVVRPTQPSSWAATAILPADHSVGWAIEDWRIRQCEALRPFAGMKGWHLLPAEIDGVEREATTTATTATGGVDLSEVPAEYRSLIPAAARWATLTRTQDTYGTPGRYLAMPSQREGNTNHVIIAWPGHERYDSLANRAAHGVPLPLHGWNISNPDRDLTYEAEPVESTGRFADVPEEYRSLMPEGVIRVRHNGASGWSGRDYYALDATDSGHPEHYILVLWPGHERYDLGGNRPGIADPMHGWYANKRTCSVVEEPTPVDPRLAEVPEEYRQYVPAEARWGTLGRQQDTYGTPGRYLGMADSYGERFTIISWPGMEQHRGFGPRTGVVEPLRGYTVDNRSWTFDDETVEAAPVTMPLRVGDRVVQVGPHTMTGNTREYEESNGIGSRGTLVDGATSRGDFRIRWDEGHSRRAGAHHSVIAETCLQRESEYDAAHPTPEAEAAAPRSFGDGDRVVLTGPHYTRNRENTFNESPSGVGSVGVLDGVGTNRRDPDVVGIRWEASGRHSSINLACVMHEDEWNSGPGVTHRAAAAVRSAVEALRTAGQTDAADRLAREHGDLLPMATFRVRMDLGTGLYVERTVEMLEGTSERDVRVEVRRRMATDPIRQDEVVIPTTLDPADVSIPLGMITRVEG